MSKLQKASSEIVPATAFADKVKQQIEGDSKLATAIYDTWIPHPIGRNWFWSDPSRGGDNSVCHRVELIPTTTTECVVADHDCPGGVTTSSGVFVECQCSCTRCLTKQRLDAGLVPRNSLFTTDENQCLGGTHERCPVVIEPISDITGRIPRVCKCVCRDCKRAWFSEGRPVVRDGKIVRTSPETMNPVKWSR